MYQICPLVRKVYTTTILVMVLGQERDSVLSEDFQKPPSSQSGTWKGGLQGVKWQKMAKKSCFLKISKIQIFLIHNVIDRLAGLRECGGTKLGHSWYGVVHGGGALNGGKWAKKYFF